MTPKELKRQRYELLTPGGEVFLSVIGYDALIEILKAFVRETGGSCPPSRKWQRCREKGCEETATHRHGYHCHHFDCENEDCVDRWCDSHRSNCKNCRARFSTSPWFDAGAAAGARSANGFEDPPV